MRANRGDFGTPAPTAPGVTASPLDENLARLREMRDGLHPTARWCCAPRSTWPRPTSTCATRPSTASAAPAPQHRRPLVHLPMYTFAHPSRTRWSASPTASARWSSKTSALLRLAAGAPGRPRPPGAPLPNQYEFGRLNLNYVVTSKRKLRQLVDEGHTWWLGRPRMPTLVACACRGWHAREHPRHGRVHRRHQAERLDRDTVLDGCLRADLEGKAPARCLRMRAAQVKLTNSPSLWQPGPPASALQRPCPPAQARAGPAPSAFGPELWIEREDFMEVPVSSIPFRSSPATRVGATQGRLRH